MKRERDGDRSRLLGRKIAQLYLKLIKEKRIRKREKNTDDGN